MSLNGFVERAITASEGFGDPVVPCPREDHGRPEMSDETTENAPESEPVEAAAPAPEVAAEPEAPAAEVTPKAAPEAAPVPVLPITMDLVEGESAAAVLLAYGRYLAFFVGAGLVAASMVGLPHSPVPYALMGLGGVALFVVAGALAELRNPERTNRSIAIAVGSAVALALGLGMIMGSVTHFGDMPDRASKMIPAGLALTMVAFFAREGFRLASTHVTWIAAAGVWIVVVASAGLSQVSAAIEPDDAHVTTSTTVAGHEATTTTVKGGHGQTSTTVNAAHGATATEHGTEAKTTEHATEAKSDEHATVTTAAAGHGDEHATATTVAAHVEDAHDAVVADPHGAGAHDNGPVTESKTVEPKATAGH